MGARWVGALVGLWGLLAAPVAARAVTSEGLALLGADVLHAQGIRGQGQKVAVLSYGFEGYAALQGTELPAAVVVQSFRSGASMTGGRLGLAAAEVVHDVAPDATLALVAFEDPAQLVSALQWTASQGYDVAVVSATFEGWEPNDGTGPVAAAANAARAAGVIVVADAGPFGDAHYLGTYEQWGYNSLHSFGESPYLFLGGDATSCAMLSQGMPIDVTLVWNDWGNNPASPKSDEDYDLFLYSYDGSSFTYVAKSDVTQNGNDAPVENVTATAEGDLCYAVQVDNYLASGSETLHLYSFFQPFESDLQHPEQSVITPCVASGVLCVGATDLTDALEPYSGRGPSVPNEQSGAQTQKPDLVAPDGVQTATFAPDAYYDPALSAAHVAGAAALALQLSNGDPAAAEALLKGQAVDLGVPGFDTSFGHGRVHLQPTCPVEGCDDGLACTDDRCDVGACVHVPLAGWCAIGGVCVEVGARQPGDACHVCSAANPTAWSPEIDGTGCDDGLFCTVGDTCAGGACQGGPARSCPTSDDPCSSSACDEGADACVATQRPNGERCGAAGDACTWSECWWGTCALQQAANHAPCADGDACTAGDECLMGSCVPGSPVACDQAPACRASAGCNPATGACEYPAGSDGQPCADDGDACSVDTCVAGTCAHAAVPDDCGGRQCGPSPSGCHACGACAEGLGCGVDGLCTDQCAGVACDPCQACQGGACVPLPDGAACAGDGNPCTTDACLGGACLHAALSDGATCDDGDACTHGDACVSGACVSGAPVTCAPPAECQTGGACDPATGSCRYDTAPDWGACPDDGNACTDDVCLGATCRHNARVDGAPCTADAFGCTVDACSAGQCLHPVSDACLIGGACRADGEADPANACLSCRPTVSKYAWAPNDGAACDDGDRCTLADACAAGACLGGAPVDCGPAAPCHLAPTCDPATGQCTSAVGADGAACDDGLTCTFGDKCLHGLCKPGAAPDCGDWDGPCTVGTCLEEAGGCAASPKPEGTLCGGGAACSGGVLFPGTACDDAGECMPQAEQPCAPYAVCASAVACATSCVGDDDCVEGAACLGGECRANGAPVADAGGDQQAGEGVSVTLDGRASSDPDGDPLTFAWSQVSGPSVDLDDPTLDTPSFVAPGVTSDQPLVFQVVVSDPWLASAPAVATVTVQNTVNEPPVADAGTDVSANEGDLVSLYGTGSSDPNADPLTYLWSEQDGVTFTLDDPTAAIAIFRAPLVNGDQVVVLKLVVNDGQANSAPDTATVTIRDLDGPPPADDGSGKDVVPPDLSGDEPDTSTAEAPGWTLDAGTLDTAPEASGSGTASGCTTGGSTPVSLVVLLSTFVALGLALRRGAHRKPEQRSVTGRGSEPR